MYSALTTPCVYMHCLQTSTSGFALMNYTNPSTSPPSVSKTTAPSLAQPINRDYSQTTSNSKKMSSKPNNQASAEFTSYYLQRATQELSEDLDKVRNAEDFKADSIPFLVHALQQGAGLFSAEDQKRVVDGSKSKDGDA